MATDSDGSVLTEALSELVRAVARLTAAMTPSVGESQQELMNAKRLGLSARTLRRMIRDGEIKGFVVGREFVVHRSDWLAFVDRQKENAAREQAAPRSTRGSADMAALVSGRKVALHA